MKFERKVYMEKGHLDLASLVDVIFLLLIFFMLTSSFVFQPGIRVTLPKALTGEVLQRKLLVFVVTSSNETYLNERPINDEELRARIAMAAREDQPLLIKADKEADLGKIIEIWDICRQLDVKQVNIATTQ